MPLEPMMLRMPHVLATPATFDEKTETLHDVAGSLTEYNNNDYDDAHVSGPFNTSEPIAPVHKLLNGTTPRSSSVSAIWGVPNTDFVLDLQIQMDSAFKEDDVFACLNKSLQSIAKKHPTERALNEWHSARFDKVVLSIRPNTELREMEDLEWRQVLTVLGRQGLYGYFEREEKFFATRFAVRDNGRLGKGRYVAFGKLKKGLLRSDGGEGVVEIRGKLLPGLSSD
ncbi:MAG: hypothetical protein Q9164_001161 [Protoblastenia rupestris]